MSSLSSAIASRAEERRYVFTLVGAFALGWAIVGTAQTVINPLLPMVRIEFHLSGVETGLLTWAFTLPYLIMQIPAGVIADRFGAKRILVFMTLVSALGLMALGLWSYALILFVVFAIVHRLGSGVYYPIAFGVATGLVPTKARGVASSMLVMGMALGTALGTAVAVPLYGLGGNSWRFPMLVIGVLMLLPPAIFQVLMRSSQRTGASVPSRVSEVFRDRSLVLLFLVNFCSNYGATVAMVWGPAFLGTERGLSLAVAGYYLAVMNLIGFPSGLVTGLLSDRFGRKRLGVLLFASAGLALAVVAGSSGSTILIVAILSYGLVGKWSSDSALTAWMGDRVAADFPAIGNAVYGVNNTARMLGALLAPPITGALLDITGTLASGFFVGAGVLLLAAVVLLFVTERRHRS